MDKKQYIGKLGEDLSAKFLIDIGYEIKSFKEDIFSLSIFLLDRNHIQNLIYHL